MKMSVLTYSILLLVQLPPKDFSEWNRIDLKMSVEELEAPPGLYKGPYDFSKDEEGRSLPRVKDYVTGATATVKSLLFAGENFGLMQFNFPAQSISGNYQRQDSYLE